jgi:hypothetical protein
MFMSRDQLSLSDFNGLLQRILDPIAILQAIIAALLIDSLRRAKPVFSRFPANASMSVNFLLRLGYLVFRCLIEWTDWSRRYHPVRRGSLSLTLFQWLFGEGSILQWYFQIDKELPEWRYTVTEAVRFAFTHRGFQNSLRESVKVTNRTLTFQQWGIQYRLISLRRGFELITFPRSSSRKLSP